MPKEITPIALKLRERGTELARAGAYKQMVDGPALVRDTADLIVELAVRIDALTSFADEA